MISADDQFLKAALGEGGMPITAGHVPADGEPFVPAIDRERLAAALADQRFLQAALAEAGMPIAAGHVPSAEPVASGIPTATPKPTKAGRAQAANPSYPAGRAQRSKIRCVGYSLTAINYPERIVFALTVRDERDEEYFFEVHHRNDRPGLVMQMLETLRAWPANSFFITVDRDSQIIEFSTT